MKNQKQNVRRITITGKTGTYYVTIPKDIVRNLNWQKGQEVVVEQDRDMVVIKGKGLFGK